MKNQVSNTVFCHVSFGDFELEAEVERCTGWSNVSAFESVWEAKKKMLNGMQEMGAQWKQHLVNPPLNQKEAEGSWRQQEGFQDRDRVQLIPGRTGATPSLITSKYGCYMRHGNFCMIHHWHLSCPSEQSWNKPSSPDQTSQWGSANIPVLCPTDICSLSWFCFRVVRGRCVGIKCSVSIWKIRGWESFINEILSCYLITVMQVESWCNCSPSLRYIKFNENSDSLFPSRQHFKAPSC